MKRLTDAQRQTARAEYLADRSLSVDQLAHRYAVSRTQMLRVLAGITRPAGGIVRSRLSTRQMQRMRDSGLTLYEISRQAGITESGVHRRLSRAGANREAS